MNTKQVALDILGDKRLERLQQSHVERYTKFR